MTPIPKIFHAVWLGHKPAPEELFQSWCTQNPDFEFRLHRNKRGWRNQKQMDFLLENMPLGEHLAYSACSDIMRFELLAEYGGVYVDADTEAFHPLPKHFLTQEAFGCWENEIRQSGWIASCVLGARPGSRLFSRIVEEIPKLDMRKHPAHELGPGIVTRFAKDFPELTVYPGRTFCPRYYEGTWAPGDAPIVAIHHWGGTPNVRRDSVGRWMDHGVVA